MRKILLLICLSPILAIANDYWDTEQWKSSEYKLFVRDILVKNMQGVFFKNAECAKLAMETNLSETTIQAFNKLQLTESELTTALSYFSYKAHLSCVGTLPLITIGYLNEARNLGIDNFSAKDDPSFKHLNDLIIDTKALVRAEYKYSQLPKDKQTALNSFDELKQPFNINVALKIKASH